MGTQLLTCFTKKDPNLAQVRKELLVGDQWSNEDYTKNASPVITKKDVKINS